MLVTGANKGIGLEIVRKLVRDHPEMRVILTSREEELGRAAAAALAAEEGREVLYHQLDITDAASRDAVGAWIETELGGKLAVLINNAGFAYKGDIFGADEADATLNVNLRGTMAITARLLPCLRAYGRGARVINVCSQAGRLNQIAVQLQDRVTATDLTEAQILALADEFVADIRAGHHREKGWSHSMYGISKLLEIAYTMVLARHEKAHGLQVNAVCPGYCRTDMSSQRGTRSAAEGAETPVWLATVDTSAWGERSTGAFYFDKRAIAW